MQSEKKKKDDSNKAWVRLEEVKDEMYPVAEAANESGHESSHFLIYKLELVKKRLFSWQLTSSNIFPRRHIV